MTIAEKDREIELLKMKLEYDTAKQQRSFQFWTTIFTAIMGVITPIVLVRYHTVADQKIEVLQKDANVLKTDAKDAAKKAEAAVQKTEEVKKDLATVSEERKVQFEQISEKQDADLKNWKAFHSKDIDDMIVAKEALQKVESKVP